MIKEQYVYSVLISKVLSVMTVNTSLIFHSNVWWAENIDLTAQNFL